MKNIANINDFDDHYIYNDESYITTNSNDPTGSVDLPPGRSTQEKSLETF